MEITIDRAVAEQALEALKRATPADSAQAVEQLNAITALRAALAEPRENIIEAVRVRIMRTAYDCADNGEWEAFNAVKVLCSDVLQILSRMEEA